MTRIYNFHFVSSLEGDWTDWYVDGKWVMGEHSLDYAHVLEYIQDGWLFPFTITYSDADMEDGGRTPLLKDVKLI